MKKDNNLNFGAHLGKWERQKEQARLGLKINNSDNRPRLARDMVDGWDLNDLQYYATSKMEDYLVELDDEEFDKEWRNFYE